MTGPQSWRIEELDRLEAIETVTERYQQTYGSKPVNVSHWNTSQQFKQRMLPLLSIPVEVNPIDYLYSYYVPGLSDVVARLGFSLEKHHCLLTPAGTSSIVAVVHWLHSLDLDRLIIYGPCYFTVVHACRALGMPVEVQYMVRDGDTYRLPALPEVHADVAIWITNPVYATGQYLQPADVDRLVAYARAGGIVVIDEALALPSLAIGRQLDGDSPFACIYSPHKAISVNAMKFSAIVGRRQDEDFFDQWADVLTGCLPASSLAAVNHFLSPAFDEYAAAFLQDTANTLEWIRAREGPHQIPTFDSGVIGNYATFFFPSLRADLGYETEFLWKIAQASGAVFIPAIRSYFDPALGLGLRANLALDSPLFRAALTRLFATLRDIV